MSIKHLSLIVLTCIITAETHSYHRPVRHGSPGEEGAMCTKKNACYDLNNNCVCYCSRKCGPRVKTADDNPVYVPNDPEGHYCYCKPWDLKNYYKMKCDSGRPAKKKMVTIVDDEQEEYDDSSDDSDDDENDA